MINWGLVSAYGLCVMGLSYAAVVQRTLIKTKDTWGLPDDVHFNVTNRPTCATICCKDVSSCAFLFSKTRHCVCLKEHGDYELWTVNLRTIIASYLGCYRDDWGRILSDVTNVTDVTTENCWLQCHGYIYFGTESADQCFCGDIIKTGYAKRPDEECNMPCAGDSSLLCGGYFRIAIYKINA